MKQPIILRIFKQDHLVEVKQLDQNQITFGRPGSEVDVFLEDESISPIHCLIEKRNEQYFICDLGSQSGVFIDKKAVLDQALESGDQIHIGQFRVEFFVGVPKPKAAPAAQIIEASVAPVIAKSPVTQTEPAKLPVSEPVVVKPQAASIEIGPQLSASRPSEPSRSVNQNLSSRGIKKKYTFAKKSEIDDLKSYLKPSSGQNVQVLVTWKERILNTYDFNRSEAIVMVGDTPKSNLKLPADLSRLNFAFIKRVGEEVDVLIPQGTTAVLISGTTQFSASDLQRMGRLQQAQAGFTVRLQNQEILNIKFDGSPVEVFVRRTPETSKIRPLGFIDLSSSELTGLVVSLVIVALVALYMTVYAPMPSEQLATEEVRLAQFVYTKPPTPPQPKVETPPPPPPVTPPPPPPPPPKEPPKKVQVTDKKVEPKPVAKPETKPAQKSGGAASDLRPKPSTVVKPTKMTSVKQGGAVKLGNTEGANAASKEKDVSKTGLLSAFGGGGNRSKLDKAYSGSGELLGMAGQASGYSGQASDRAGDDLGSKFKDDGAGGKGIATQGIANLGTKGRGSGNSGYGSVGDGDGKGRVEIDVPGSSAEFVGSIDREAVRKVIRGILSQIRSCYEKQLRLNPSLGGKLVITFEIAEQGRVTSSKPKSSTLADAEVGRCVAARIQAQRFPEPPAGTIAVVDFPFVFDSQK